MTKEDRLKYKIEIILNKRIDKIDFTSIIQSLQIMELNIGIYSICSGNIMTSNRTIKFLANQDFTELTESDKQQLFILFDIQ